MNENKPLPIAALLFGATMWGIIWYPYRLLTQVGVAGELSTFVTYALALVATTLLFPRAWGEVARAPMVLLAVGLASGWCNLAYVLGVLHGEVMRVLLLFYLAPLWTVPLARLVLGERIGGAGYVVVGLAFSGAAVMLWNRSAGLPVPSSAAEWLGLTAGFSFALANVMVRRATGCGVPVKTLSVFAGVALLSLCAVLWGGLPMQPAIAPAALPLVLAIAVMLIGMSLAVQYGLSHVSATRAIVILLFELVVAAVASYLLASETMGGQEWVGGAMIITASLFSGHIKHEERRVARVPVGVDESRPVV